MLLANIGIGFLIAAAAFALYAGLRYGLHIEGITIKIPKKKV
jgi:hypothetical protein